MIDPKGLAALQEAARLIEAEVPEPSPEETRAAEDAARLADQARRRRPTPEEQARAWKARNRDLKRRPKITIDDPEKAIGIWRRGVRRRTGGDRPIEPGERSPRAGQTAEEQVIARVRQTRDLLAPGESLADAIAAWPLPQTFYDDAPPLCGMEEELLADPRAYEPPAERAALPEGRPEGDGRLLRGLRRAEDGGLHG